MIDLKSYYVHLILKYCEGVQLFELLSCRLASCVGHEHDNTIQWCISSLLFLSDNVWGAKIGLFNQSIVY